jgi:magnesium transporter
VRRLEKADARRVGELRSKNESFWLDLAGESVDSELASISEVLGLTTDNIREATQFGQHPRIASLGEHTLLVLFGAGQEADGGLEMVEVHLLLGADHLITARRGRIVELESLRIPDASTALAAPVIGALIDSLLAAVETIDDEIEELEGEIIERLDEEQMRRLTKLRRSLVEVRHVGTPERDLFLRHADELGLVPGLSPELVSEASSRLVAARDVVDSTRELASGALDLYLSSASNRLNRFAERLTIVTIVILPFVVLSGSFGQNFAWLVAHIDSLVGFLVLGLLAPAAIGGGLLYFLRRRGYL